MDSLDLDLLSKFFLHPSDILTVKKCEYPKFIPKVRKFLPK